MSPRSKRRRNKQPQQRQPDQLHDIGTFCAANRISESYYFSLKRAGRGPREIKLGKRTLITPEAERDWRTAMEAETLARRQAESRKAAAAPAEASAAT
jgi:hypothetical protein